MVLLPELEVKNLMHVTRRCSAAVAFPTLVPCALGFVIVVEGMKMQQVVAESRVFLAGLASVLTFRHVTS